MNTQATRIHKISLTSIELGAMLEVLTSIETSTTKTLTKNSITRLTSYLVNITKIKQGIKLQGAELIAYSKHVELPEASTIYEFEIIADLILEMRK